VNHQNIVVSFKSNSSKIKDLYCNPTKLFLSIVQRSITIMEKEYFVFVYGTLKRKEPNHEKYLSTSKFVTTACTIEKFPLVIASKYNIPFALDHPGLGKNLKGEIYIVNEESLAALDELENHPVLYERRLLEFEVENGTNQTAWIYLLKKFKAEMLELPFYDSYLSEGSHGKRYVPRYEREGEKALAYDSIQ